MNKTQDWKEYKKNLPKDEPDWEEWKNNLPTKFLEKNTSPDLHRKNKNRPAKSLPKRITMSEEKWEEINNGATIKKSEEDIPY